MTSSSLRGTLLLCALMLVVPTFTLHAVSARSSNSTGSGAGQGLRPVPNEVPPIVTDKTARSLSSLAGNRRLLVNFGLGLRNEQSANDYIQTRAFYGHYLSQAAFMRRFAPLPAQVRRVEEWTRSQGFKLVYASPDGLDVTVSGPASRFERSLHVALRRYVAGGKSFYANDAAPLAPADLGFQTITGLDDLQRAVDYGIRRLATPTEGYIPRQLRAAYDLSSAYDGTGQTIGVTNFGQPVPNSDFAAFARANGEPQITSCTSCTGPDKVQWFMLDGSTSDPVLDEQAMDVEYIHGLALHSHIKYWLGDDGSNAGMEDAVAGAASDPSVHIVSNSWGETGIRSKNDPFVRATTNSFKHAVIVGTTFYFSTGDNAADSGCSRPLKTRCRLASYPADSPYVVAVGGTNLQMNSSFTNWASETPWNLQLSDDSGGGGGCAPFFRRPMWQQGVAAATCGGRAIPDISADGDVLNSPVDVWVNGGSEQVGGTSVSASLVAGMAAVTDRYLSLARLPLMGFAAPRIYQMARSADHNAYFHDVLCGSNTYPAGLGWDEATGWGSIDWYAYTRGFAGQPVDPPPPMTSWTCNPHSGTGVGLRGIACPRRTYGCHAVGGSGVILNTSDGWFWRPPASTSARGNLVAVECPGVRTCYALGADGWIQRTRDSGQRWKAERVVAGPATTLFCPDALTCYVLSGESVFKTQNGRTFVRQTVSPGRSLAAISCPTRLRCYAVTSHGAVVTTVDGKSWRTIVGTPPAGGTVTSLACPGAGHCYAVGAAYAPHAPGASAFVYSTLNGTRWSAQVIAASGPLAAVSCAGIRTCDAVGPTGTVLRTTDGKTWTSALPGGSAGARGLTAVDCPRKSLCYAVGTTGRIVQIGSSR